MEEKKVKTRKIVQRVDFGIEDTFWLIVTVEHDGSEWTRPKVVSTQMLLDEEYSAEMGEFPEETEQQCFIKEIERRSNLSLEIVTKAWRKN